MRLYLAGADRNYQHLLGLDDLAFLVSYFYLLKNQSTWQLVEMCNQNNIPILLDCGAWSAMTQNIELDNQEFIKFCLEHQSKFTEIVCLDVIGDAEKTKANYLQAVDAGLSGIPTFHMDSSFDYLDFYAEYNTYIGLGGVASRTVEKQTENWLKYIFDQYPEHSFHGFGITTPRLLKQFNWESVDGTTWITGALRYGRLMYNCGDGSFIWIHLNNQEQLEKYWHLIKDDIKDGWSLEDGRTEQYEVIAMRYNAKSLIDLVQYCSKHKTKERQLFLL